jgi:hypothetical protein
MACELHERFRILLTANDDMVERALQGFARALKATHTATVQLPMVAWQQTEISDPVGGGP